MFKINSSCNLLQGFNFNRNNQSRIMYVKSLIIGTVMLNPDFDVIDPTTGDKSVVVGVGGYLGWRQQKTSPLFMRFYASHTNTADLSSYVGHNMDNTSVSFEVEIFEYDPNAKQYFKAFHCDAQAMKGEILCDSQGKLAGFIEKEPSKLVQSPLNYQVNFGFSPAAEEQLFITQTSNTIKVCNSWGVKSA
ncbi:hypothetical protein PsalMR5_03523 [Piscirickettsia salmonis]|uniref:hypothetical protein n=2 Tax=Piscirickettsia salmonis TaxID=1238 RepID=UPI0012BAB41B|nr:hypothetical protein [Piscirickettsia salmonis]QGP56047.1 hypothetical protein PsalSR1_03517 [Piscirickettsia salmonis]QGP58082.1 hypothetical protein PsalBI1_00636 [Piscirickettsia salmonis]QGP65617.1 hypothetical protein PsalMR5_03523 [Piscirickettsia salmonis]